MKKVSDGSGKELIVTFTRQPWMAMMTIKYSLSVLMDAPYIGKVLMQG